MERILTINSQEYQERYQEAQRMDFLREDATDEIVEVLINAKEKIQEEQEKGKKVVVVNATWDLLHMGHMWYLQTLERKILDQFGISRQDLYLMVGVEWDQRVKERKWNNRPIYSDWIRQQMILNQQQVDDTYKYEYMDEDRRPSDVALFLEPDWVVLHEEHLDTADKVMKVYRKLSYDDIKLILLRVKDSRKYGVPNYPEEYWVSTTNTLNHIKQM